MLAFCKGALSELARGISTAIVVRSAVITPECHCSCPEFPRLPDCICAGETRRCPDTPCPAVDFTAYVTICVLVFVVGVFVGRWKSEFVVVGRPLPPSAATEPEEEIEDVTAQARAQEQFLRSRPQAWSR